SVALSGRERRLLQLLVRRFPGRVGILSGRSLAQLRRKVASPKLIYGGAHGFEIYGPGLRWRFAAPLGRHRAFEKVIRWLQEEGAEMRGFWVEVKTWTCDADYRQVQKIDKTRLYALLQRPPRQARNLGVMVQ